MLDTTALAKSTALIIREVTAPLIARIDALEKQLAERPTALTEEDVRTIVGEQGEPVTKEIVSDMIADAVGAIPPAEVPAINEVAIAERVKALVMPTIEEAVQAIPVPQDGKSVDMDEVRALLSEMTAETVTRAVEALPRAKDGADGIGIAKLLVDRDGVLNVTKTDGSVDVVGKITGEDGKPGRDGFQLEDFDVEATEDPRTMVLTFAQGEVKYRYEIDLPIPLYRSVWKEGEEYVRGDMCTWAGSLWHCDVGGTKSKPDAGDWTLCVKRGRDGKSAT